MQTSDPLVSIIILNWDGLENTKECLKSIRQLNYENIEIILVDNGSVDGSKKYFSKLKIPKLKIIYLDKNYGFTGGNIEGYKRSSGEIIFLINNDALVDPQIVKKAVKIFADDIKIAAVGSRAYLWDQQNPPYNTNNQFYSYQRIDPFTAEAYTLSQDWGPCEPNNISGSAVFIRRSAIDKVGYLDDKFFAYYEETDLFARFKRAGFKVVYNPELCIWHKVGDSTKDNTGFFYYFMFRNQFQYAIKNFDGLYLKSFIYYYIKTNSLALIKYIFRKDVQISESRLKGFIWNMIHLNNLVKRRRLTQKLGDSYSLKIINESIADVSVIIDHGSSYDDIVRSLNSVEAQSIKTPEIIAVKKGKINNQELSLLNRFHNLRYISDKDCGPASSFDLGAICANSTWLIFINSGVTIPKNTLKSVYLLYLKKPKTQLIIGRKKKSLINKLRFKNSIFLIPAIKKSVYLNAKCKNTLLNQDSLLRYLIKNGRRYKSCILEVNGTEVNNLNDNVLLLVCYMKRRYLLIPLRIIRLYINKMLRSKFSLYLRVLCINVYALSSKQYKISFVKSVIHPLSASHIRNVLVDNYDNYKSLQYLTINPEKKRKFKKSDIEQIVAFINCRDRVVPLKALLKWLNEFGIKKIILIDNQSTYKPLMDFYANTTFQVLPLNRNAGHTAPWDSMAISLFAHNNYYILSDPDIIPVEDCPTDAISYFYKILIKYKNIDKVGFGLKIDDLPGYYHLKDVVINWEKQYWDKQTEPRVYLASIDTTFALYKPHSYYSLEDSLRTGEPYVARHLPWYQNSNKLSAEEKYYKKHSSPIVNTWNKEDIPEHFKKAIAKVL